MHKVQSLFTFSDGDASPSDVVAQRNDIRQYFLLFLSPSLAFTLALVAQGNECSLVFHGNATTQLPRLASLVTAAATTTSTPIRSYLRPSSRGNLVMVQFHCVSSQGGGKFSSRTTNKRLPLKWATTKLIGGQTLASQITHQCLACGGCCWVQNWSSQQVPI